MKELYIRTIYGFIFAVTLLGSILIGSWGFGVLFSVISVLVLKEFYTLARLAGYKPQILPGLITGAFLFIFSFLITKNILPVSLLGVFLPVLFLFPIYELFRGNSNSIGNIAITVYGILYIIVPFSLFNLLVFPSYPLFEEYNPKLLIFLFVILWSNDSGAYIFGVTLGRHKLFERISPKKTWEGFFGGWLLALVAAWIISMIFPEFSLSFLALMASIIVFAGTLGDLVESMYKRNLGIKDSGRFLPGHGGLLDRFDSILFATPFIYFLLLFLA